MWKKTVLLLAFGLAIASADFQLPNLDKMGNILQTLKDTSMMDQFQEKFSQMFIKQKATKQKEERTHEEDEIDNETSSDPQYDVYEFAKSYNTEKKLELSDKIMFYLSDLPIGESYHVHTAKLSGILDQIANISRLRNKNLDGKVIDLVRRVKSLSILKTSLERMHQEALQSGQRERKMETNTEGKTSSSSQAEAKKERKKTTLKKDDKANVEEDAKKGLLPENIKFHLDSIREDPDQLIDWLINTILDYDLLSESTVDSYTMYIKLFANTQYFNYFVDWIASWLEELSRTDIGRKFVSMVPGLMQANDMEEIFEIVNKEADLSMNRVIVMIKDYGMQDQIAEFFAAFMSAGIKGFHEVIFDSTKITMANTFLLTQGLPTIDINKLPSSISILASKFLSLFSVNINVKKYEKLVVETVKAFDRDFMKWSEFNPLSEEEQLPILVKFLHLNVADSFNHLWQAYQHSSKHPEGMRCLQNMLCNINLHIKTKSTRLQMLMTKSLSFLASWAWSFDGSVEYRDLNEAIVRGLKKEDCDQIYGQPDVKQCHILPWQVKSNREEL